MKPEDIADKMQIIEAQAVRMGLMLNDILSLGQAGVPQIGITRQCINICTFFDALKSEIELQFNGSHHINFAARINRKELFTDEDLLRNIFTNLLGNAIKFSSGKTEVWLEVCDAEDGLVVTVRDEGMGIEEEEMLKIFEPFRRGSNATGIPGTGLGLCIVKRSVEALQGSIEVSSSRAQGSVFKVTIPTV
jgi:signal transduction histidine kinase